MFLFRTVQSSLFIILSEPKFLVCFSVTTVLSWATASVRAVIQLQQCRFCPGLSSSRLSPGPVSAASPTQQWRVMSSGRQERLFEQSWANVSLTKWYNRPIRPRKEAIIEIGLEFPSGLMEKDWWTKDPSCRNYFSGTRKAKILLKVKFHRNFSTTVYLFYLCKLRALVINFNNISLFMYR